MTNAPHRDFTLIERDGMVPDARAQAARQVLRASWNVPRDTFVTADLPLLLTKLSQPGERGPRR